MNKVHLLNTNSLSLLESLINDFAEWHMILNVSISTYYTSFKEARYVAAIVYEVSK